MSEESCRWEMDFKFRWCFAMCDSLQCELSEGKGFMLQCVCHSQPAPLKAHPCSPCAAPDSQSWGSRGEQVRNLFPKVRHAKLSWLQHSAVHGSLLRLHNILSVSVSARGVILAAAAPWWSHGSELWLHAAHPCPFPCLGPLCFCRFVCVLLPQRRRGSFPNHHEDDFGDEWSCVSFKKLRRVSSTAVCVFSKAFFCCSGIIAALAQFACLINFLVQLLKVFCLLLHWWCY